MSFQIGRWTNALALLGLCFIIASCRGPDTSDCATTATCAYVGAPQNDAAVDQAETATEAASTDDGGGEAGETPDSAPGGCPSNDTCDPGTVCGDGGVCVPGCTPTHACPSGQSCCGSVCVDANNDVAHCGGCDVSCKADHGTAKCDQGACAIASCSTGFLDCNQSYEDGCETTDPGTPSVAPQLMTPTIGAYTGSVHAASSLKPTFTWLPVAGPGTCKNTYEIQIDASCTAGDIQSCAFSKTTLDVADIATTSFVSADALPVSTQVPVGQRYYWRVRTCDTLKRCSPWSKVRYVNVGRLPDDFNGDGYSDAAIEHVSTAGGYTDVHADICLGGSPLNGVPDYEVSTGMYSLPDAASRPTANAGDVNADGFADLIVGNRDLGNAHVYLGAATLTKWSTSDRTFNSDVPDLDYGYAVAGAGDVNGDGFDDLLIGAPLISAAGTSTVSPRTYVYFGAGNFSTSTTPPTVLTGVSANVRGVGDIDQDGYPDFVSSDSSGGFLYVRAPNGQPDPLALPSTGMTARAGDLNGDGYDDFIIWNETEVRAVWGRPWSSTVSSQVLFTVTGTSVTDVVGGRDVDGDGMPDVLVGIGASERVVVIRGQKPFPAATQLGQFPALVAPTGTGQAEFGRAVGMGDYDGDGRFDAVIGFNNNPTDVTHSGAAWIVPGSQLVKSYDSTMYAMSVPLALVDPYRYGTHVAQ